MFAIEQIAVDGASPEVAAQVREALAPALGESLVGLDVSELAQRAASVPMVARAGFDRGFPHTLRVAVASVVAERGELTLVLRSGLELRLGDGSDLPLKLEVARQVLPQIAGSSGYLDVSVPNRPVAGETLDSQVEVEGSASTVP